MAKDFPNQELDAARLILADFNGGQFAQGIERLGVLRDDLYAAIPEKKRISQGITWVLLRICDLLVAVCSDEEQLRQMAINLADALPGDDRLLGVALFLMAAYGKTHPQQALPFFEHFGASPDWVVREFAAAGLHKVIAAQRQEMLPWLQATARHKDANLRRMVSEALRPVTNNRWIQQDPQYSLSVLRIMFTEPDAYPRTSVGNNLSDLARQNAELIFGIVQELVESGNPDSYWIAYRACRNLVKKEPQRVLDLLRVDEYHYKDRHVFR